MLKFLSKIGRMPVAPYLASTAGILLVGAAFYPFHQHLRTTPGLFFLMVIVLVAIQWGRRPALFAALLAVFTLNYLYMPPFNSLRLTEARYTLMTVAFGITALTVGQLSARSSARARDAEHARAEIQHLYEELKNSFEQAAQAEAVRRTADRLKLAEAVASTGSFDLHPPGCARFGPSAPDFWSDSFYQVMGIDRATRPSFENWISALHPDDSDQARKELEEFALSSEEHRQVDYRISAPGGGVRWINTRCRMVRNSNGAAIRLVGAAIDVTERQHATEAIRSSEQFKSLLLDCLTHDLGTPLTSMKLESVSLLRDQKLELAMTGDQRASLRAIDEQIGRLHKFIQSLISMARVHAGELHLRLSELPVNCVIAEGKQRVRALCASSRIRWNIPQDLPPVEADARAVAEVIYTIVENACKYGLAHAPITVTADHSGTREVFFAIENSGPAIPPELRERVFDRFYRIEEAIRTHGPRSSHASGNGMGLAIARGMIHANNGRIWIEDIETGEGTRVVFTLPVWPYCQRETDFSI